MRGLEKKAGVMFPSSEHPVTAWLVEHVDDVLTKYLVGSDGHTAYERLFGKQAREEGLEFGEQVLHRKRRAQDMTWSWTAGGSQAPGSAAAGGRPCTGCMPTARSSRSALCSGDPRPRGGWRRSWLLSVRRRG